MATTCYYDIQNVCKPFKPSLFKEGDVTVSYTHLTLPTTPYV